MKFTHGEDGRTIVIVDNVPALTLVFEYEAAPTFVVSPLGHELPQVLEWIEKAHPTWMALLEQVAEELREQRDG